MWDPSGKVKDKEIDSFVDNKAKNTLFLKYLLNQKQSLSMKDNIVQVNAKTVYDFTGSPSPQFINEVMDVLLN